MKTVGEICGRQRSGGCLLAGVAAVHTAALWVRVAVNVNRRRCQIVGYLQAPQELVTSQRK